MSDTPKPPPSQGKPATIQLAVIAMATLVPLYMVLGYVITGTGSAVVGPAGPEVLADLYAYPLAVVSAVAPLLAAWQMDRTSLSAVRAMEPLTMDRERRQRKLLERRFLAFSLRLAPGVTGLGLTILRYEFFWVAILGSLSLVAMVLTLPTSGRLEKAYRQLEQTESGMGTTDDEDRKNRQEAKEKIMKNKRVSKKARRKKRQQDASS